MKGTILRFLLMLAIVVILSILSQYVLAIALGYIVAISAILGVTVNVTKPKQSYSREKTEKLRPVKKEAISLEVAYQE
jgi:uncharacterized protein (DUF58 family)